MAAPKRTPKQIARDRKLIADLYLNKHLLQAEIAAQLNARPEVDYTLSQRMISYDLQKLEERWIESGLMDLNAAKGRELARIDRLECEYWDAWEAVKPTNRTAPRYLEGIMSCIERRCKLLGLDAPNKVAPTDPTGTEEYDGIGSFKEQLIERLNRLADAHGAGGVDAELK
jgi:hypothetical protein